MKGILEFELPEDKEAFELANRGIDYYCALHDIGEVLRKHINDKLGDVTLEEKYERIKDDIMEVYYDRSIEL